MKFKINDKLKIALVVISLAVFAYVAVYGIDSNKTGSASNIHLGLDLAGGVSVTYEIVDKNATSSDISDTVYKIQKRIEGLSRESEVYREGENRITVDIPGVTDASSILESIGKPGALSFTDSEFNVLLTGSDVAQATAERVSNEFNTQEFEVALKFNEEGTQKFAQATQANIGKPIYIMYDDEMVSQPTVTAAITTGEASISGMADYDEANTLAQTIRIGALPLELKELRSSIVQAKLGAEALDTSLQAAAIGLALVILFMIVLYRLPGVVAGIALILYTLLIVLVLNGFDVTLTLPGIAGIVLSIGMAVDANVIIFTRIKEEVTEGKTVRMAVKTGFEKALSAIIDGNITTLIAALVLYVQGSGTVRGFAETLAIGIILSMFSALVISKMLIDAFVALGANQEKYFGRIRHFKHIKVVKNRYVIFALSIVIIGIGFVKMGMNQSSTGDVLNFGLDFKGGTMLSISFNEELAFEKMDDELKPLLEKAIGSADIQPVKIEGGNDVNVKTPLLDLETRKKVEKALMDKYKIKQEQIASENISATVSGEMRQDAVIAVIISLICMLIYIWVRFKDIRFGTSAVLALLHDVLVVLTVYAVLDISVGNVFIACMLTIVGYSINATIVIFDRIRENLKIEKKASTEEVVDLSINQTMTRSINTSFTTFITVFVLYMMGVSSIKEFTLPLMAGIVCGAYSSIFETGTIWFLLRKIQFKKG